MMIKSSVTAGTASHGVLTAGNFTNLPTIRRGLSFSVWAKLPSNTKYCSLALAPYTATKTISIHLHV